MNTAWDQVSLGGGYERRGRWVADIWFDPVCLAPGESAKLVQDREANKVSFSLSDEIALRHRFCLVPFGPASNMPPYASGPIDSYLPFSLLWSRRWSGSKYNLPPSRWARFNFNDVNERLDTALIKGWQSLLDPEDLALDNAFIDWDATLVKAVYNFQFYQKEPGAWAHNTDYIAELLIDSIADLGGDTSALNRP